MTRIRALESGLREDRPGIVERLRGQVVDVRFPHDNDVLVLVYADGREVQLRAIGWEAEGICIQ